MQPFFKLFLSRKVTAKMQNLLSYNFPMTKKFTKIIHSLILWSFSWKSHREKATADFYIIFSRKKVTAEI
jgi:hypothetical protein